MFVINGKITEEAGWIAQSFDNFEKMKSQYISLINGRFKKNDSITIAIVLSYSWKLFADCNQINEL